MTLSKRILDYFGPRLNVDCDSRGVLEYLSECIERVRGKANRMDIDYLLLENLLLMRYMLFGIDPERGGCDVCGRVKAHCHPLNCPKPAEQPICLCDKDDGFCHVCPVHD